ncbi:hypothetical protein AB0H03_42215, partial [Streptomyces sparsogenes]
NSFGYGLGTATSFQAASQQARSGVTQPCSSPKGFVVGEEGHIKVIAIVQYARKTSDGRYDAGKGEKIGVITAYCEGVNKCPAWVNQ